MPCVLLWLCAFSVPCTCLNLLQNDDPYLGLAIHDFTYGSGFHSRKGGPKREMKRREDICSTRRSIYDLRGVQIKFIFLNPRSHSAVLTGSMWILPISLLIFLPETSAPFISLKSLHSCFKSLAYGNKNLLHASLSSFSPYSDETVKGQEVGNKVLTHSIVGHSDSGISCAEMESART